MNKLLSLAPSLTSRTSPGAAALPSLLDLLAAESGGHPLQGACGRGAADDSDGCRIPRAELESRPPWVST